MDKKEGELKVPGWMSLGSMYFPKTGLLNILFGLCHTTPSKGFSILMEVPFWGKSVSTKLLVFSFFTC